jgi:hypothetical protein
MCTDAEDAITSGRWVTVPGKGGRADWAKLTEFLSVRSKDEEQVTLSWSELNEIVGPVPVSATRHRPQWWHGDRSHVRAWRVAGYALAHVQPGRSVTFRRSGAVRSSGPRTPRQPVAPAVAAVSPVGGVQVLQEIDPRDALLVIPCSKRKRDGGEPPIKGLALDQLPPGTYPYTAEGLASYRKGETFSTVGWTKTVR